MSRFANQEDRYHQAEVNDVDNLTPEEYAAYTAYFDEGFTHREIMRKIEQASK